MTDAVTWPGVISGVLFLITLIGFHSRQIKETRDAEQRQTAAINAVGARFDAHVAQVTERLSNKDQRITSIERGLEAAQSGRSRIWERMDALKERMDRRDEREKVLAEIAAASRANHGEKS